MGGGNRGILRKLEKDLEKVKKQKKVALTIDQPAPRCSGQLVKEVFPSHQRMVHGCSNYPNCNHTRERNTPTANRFRKRSCWTRPPPVPKTAELKRHSLKTRRYFTGCSGYPQCTYIEKEAQDLGNARSPASRDLQVFLQTRPIHAAAPGIRMQIHQEIYPEMEQNGPVIGGGLARRSKLLPGSAEPGLASNSCEMRPKSGPQPPNLFPGEMVCSNSRLQRADVRLRGSAEGRTALCSIPFS